MPNLSAYKLGERLHEGRRFDVVRATAPDGKSVVLKVLRELHPSTERIARFRHEFDTLTNLDSPHIVAGYELVTDQRRWALVQEDFGGSALHGQLGPDLDLSARLDIAIAVASGLADLHAQHVIHKDINPSNIVRNPTTGEVKLIDFGIATALRSESPAFSNRRRLEGTLRYISPEQTGRVLASVDYRSDLYSFGATLYELFVGRPPFDTDDAVELVHAHIARKPNPPHEVSAQVPPVLSAIIMRLLEKDVDARYQSTFGVLADLRMCRRVLSADGTIARFEIGADDVATRLLIPPRLYGRQDDVQQLIDAFATISDETGGRAPGMLVTGAAGLGKTALVRELFAPLTERRGFFLSGKFEQFRRTPFAAVVAAFRGLIIELLGEEVGRLERLRNDLVAAIGPNGRVLTDVIPQLQLIIGVQPAVQEIGAAATVARFTAVFAEFVRVFARPAHPVVLFVDDLQWADVASLDLLRALLGDDELSLFVIGAYRDNEVDSSHPLTAAIKRLAADGINLPTLSLAPLTAADVTQLVADTAHCRVEEAAPLGALIHRNTGGNPLFAREFLKALGDDGLLQLSRGDSRWSWDLDEIRAKGFTESVLDLMTARLQRLGETTREVLSQAACVGASFELPIVASLRNESVAEVWAALLPAVEQGLVVATSELDVLIADAASPDQRCSFFHDRIQQAAYEQLSTEGRTATHLAVGQMLLQRRPATDVEAGSDDGGLFEQVFHLNRGRGLLAGDDDREQLARLDLDAGRRAFASAAFTAATDYLDVGLSLLPDNAWTVHYDLAMQLHERAAHATYAAAEYERAGELIGRCIEQARTEVERAELHVVMIQQHTASGRYPDAIAAARDGLALVGFDLPRDGFMDAMMASFGALQAELAGAGAESFLDRPRMTDPVAIAQCRLLSWTMAPAFFIDPLLYSVISFEAMRIIHRHGNPTDALAIFAQYGHLLSALFGDPPGGYAFTELSRTICERDGNLVDKAEACFLSGNFALAWVKPLREARAVLEEGMIAGLQSGGLQFARYNMCYLDVNDFIVGEPLGAILAETTEHVAHCARHRDRIAEDCLQALRQVVNGVAGNTPGPGDFSCDGIPEEAFVERLSGGAPMVLAYYTIFKTTAQTFHRDFDGALQTAEQATALLPTIPGNVCAGRLVIFAGIATAGVLAERTGEERDALRANLDKAIEQLAGFSVHCEANWAHGHALLQAEAARLDGDGPAAIDAYERAIRLAQEHNWPADHALACELAGRYWAAQGRDELATGYLAQAHYGYEQWGAAHKVTALASEFPGIRARASGKVAITTTRSVSVTNTEQSTGAIDLASVIKASQAISGEMRLDRLLERLMALVLENAGAQHGVLVVRDRDELAVRAAAAIEPGEESGDASVRHEVDLNISLHGYGKVAASVVNYAARTEETVVIDDALAGGPFARDPHIVRSRPRSILCLPLRNKGELLGVLYLENTAVTGTFTTDRLEVVNLIASQFAISYENARLYNDMESLVGRRTEQLAQKNEELEGTLDDLRQAQGQLIARNDFIRSVFGRYVSDDVVEHLLQAPEALQLGGQRRPITVLASDVRGFTALAERLDAEAVLTLLNSYFEAMFAVIHRHGGTINAILGDGLFVFFGAPIPQADAPRRAVACALEMMLELDALKARGDVNLAGLEMGIGVHSGAAVVGNIGSQQRTKYSAIGLDVNLAARIESYTVGGQILISEATAAAIRPDVEVSGSMELSAKGVGQTLQLHEVSGLAGDPPIRYSRQRAQLAALAEPIAVEFSVVSGGVVAPTTHRGTLTRLSSHEGELAIDVQLAPLTDLKCRLAGLDGGDLYAKVLATSGSLTRVGFTSVPPALKAALHARLAAAD